MAAKRPHASARLTDAGKKPVQLWLDETTREKIFAAAHADGRHATQFLIFHGLKAAEKILEKSKK